VVAFLNAMTAQISIPARIDHYVNQTVPTTGTTITFQPDNAAVASPFNGGPLSGGVGNHPLPALNFTWPGNPGINYVIDAISLSSVTFHFVNGSGAAVAVSGVNVIAEGF